MKMKILAHKVFDPDSDFGGGGEASPPAEAAATDSSVDFGELVDGYAANESVESGDDIPSGAEPPASSGTGAAAAATPGQTAAAVPAPASSSAPAPVAPPPAASPQAAPAAPVPPPQAVAPETPPADPASASAQPDFEQHRQTFLPQLKELYKLTDEEAAAFQANPAEELPNLAAKLHYEVQVATFNAVMQSLPQLLDQFSSQREAVQRNENQFYDKWPKLKEKPEYKETVISAIKAYRTANPKMPMEAVIQQAGLMAMLTLGLPLDLPGTQPQPPAPPAPQLTPGLPARPAGIGGSGAPLPRAQGGQSGNIFADIVEDDLRGT